MKKRHDVFKPLTALLLLLTTIVAMFSIAIPEPKTAEAYMTYIDGVGNVDIIYSGGDEYEVGLDENDNLVITGKYYSNSSATLSYHTVALYFRTDIVNERNPIIDDNYFYVDVAKHITSKPDSDGYVHDTYIVSNAKLTEMIIKFFGPDGLKEPQQVYMSEGFKLKKRKSSSDAWGDPYGNPYTSLTTIQGAADWSNTTYNNFEMYYNIPLTLSLQDKKFTLTVDTTEGGIPYGDSGEIEVGTAVTVGASANTGYKFVEWQGNTSGLDATDWSESEISFTMPERDVHLTGVFEKVEGVTPIPTHAPVSITPMPTKKPNVTPTPTPTPEPTPEPKPSYPTEDRIIYEEYHRYYTTDKGYTIEGIRNKGGKMPNHTSATYWTISKFCGTNAKYSVGTDAEGNTWFFLPSGSNATLVHPDVYKGYDANTAEVAYITELTFPSKLTCNGTTYTVTSIGGGTSAYKSGTGPSASSWNENGIGYTQTEEYEPITGGYDYYRCLTSMYNTNYQASEAITHRYWIGSVGNGGISGSGVQDKFWPSTGAVHSNNYEQSYTVYNTTLASITIPDTVTRIEEYAFNGCQALVKIIGGKNVKEIGTLAFDGYYDTIQVSEQVSDHQFRYYYYNESWTFTTYTPTMVAYGAAVKLSKYLELPEFPSLKTIEKRAFSYRSNLFDVVLPKGLATISENAFLNCKLNSIEIPGESTVIGGEEDTLGTKGTTPRVTTIITVPESKAMYYGLEYIRYYKLRCGYEVTYVNNFAPEETYTTTAELKEQWATPVKSVGVHDSNTLSSSYQSFGDIVIDEENNAYFLFKNSRVKGTNVLPQRLEYGKVADIRSIANTSGGSLSSGGGGYREEPQSRPYLFAMSGKVYACTGVIKDTSDVETPFKTTWEDVGVPEGASSHCWGVTENESTETFTKYLYYLTKEGTVQFAQQSRWKDTGDIYTYSKLYLGGRETTQLVANMPDDVKFKAIYVGNSSEKKTSFTQSLSGVGRKVTRTDKVSLPTVYAIASDGTHWTGTCEKNVTQVYYEKYANGVWTPETTPQEVTVTEKDYVWEKISEPEYRLKWSAPGEDNPSGEVNLALTDIFYGIKSDGSLVYYNSSASADKREIVIYDRTQFVDRKVVDGRTILIDENGASWLFVEAFARKTKSIADTDSAAPGLSKVTEVNEVERIFYGVYGDYATTDTYDNHKFLILDDAGHLSHRCTKPDGTGYLYDAGELATVSNVDKSNATFDEERIVKIKYRHSQYGKYFEQIMFLTDKGNLWVCGINHSAWDETAGGHYYKLGPSGEYVYLTATRVNGSIKVADFFLGEENDYYGEFSFIEDVDGNVYVRGGNYGKDTILAEDGTVEPYSGWKLANCPLPIDQNSFLARYHFSETIYDNMFSRDNYTFLRWNEEPDDSGATLYPNDEYLVEEPLTLYAQWEKTANKVRYHPNGGAGYMEDTVCDVAVKTTVLRKNTYTKNGYEFTGWNTKKDGTGATYKDGVTFVMRTGTTVLYAQWKPFDYTVKVAADDVRVRPIVITDTYDLAYDETFTVPAALPDKSYTVGYDLNKRSTMSTTPYWKTTLPLSNEYTKAKLTFLGWQLYEEQAVNTEYNYLKRFLLPGEVTKNLAVNKDYPPVLFPYWGGDAAYVKLPTAACDGYWFIGWTDDKNETDEEKVIHAEAGSGAQYKPKANETLYGYYEPREYDITLIAEPKDAGTGEIIHTQTSVTMTFDKRVPSVVIPESDRYVFMGYYDKLDTEGRPTADAVQYYDAKGNGLQTWCIHDGSVAELYAYMISEVEVTLDGRGATKQEQTSVKMTYDKAGPDVIPPEKIGYTFKGYYTEIRGGGTQYFDTSGKGTNIWREKDVDILYASWEQNPVGLPEKEDTEGPELLPEHQVRLEVLPENNRVELYSEEYNVATEGIPSTETVNLRAKSGALLLSCLLERKSGVEMVRMHVTVPYRTQYEDAESEELIISERKIKNMEVMVPKAWSYWIVKEGGLYLPEQVSVRNDSLEEGSVELPVLWDTVNAVRKPSYRLTTYDEDRLEWPAYDADGTPSLSIEISEEQYIVSDTPGKLPEAEAYLKTICYNVALRNETQFSVRSDGLEVENVVLLSDVVKQDGQGMKPQQGGVDQLKNKLWETDYSQARQEKILLQTTASNREYETLAEVVYIACKENVGSVAGKRVAVSEANPVLVHTPVLCVAEVTANHEAQYQCETVPAGSEVLVLDEAGVYSDFVLRVVNEGYHSDRKGYGLRDYGKYLATKDGAARNEVRFPVAVWMDVGNDKDNGNDVLLESGVWYTVGTVAQRFYVPFWTKEGNYTFEVRAVAINSEGKEDKTEALRNQESENYVATSEADIYLTGRLYDFTVYGITGTAAWDEVRQVPYCYTVGSSGEIKTDDFDWFGTLPLRKGGHPKYRNLGGLPVGGGLSFRLKSVGSFFSKETKLTLLPEVVRVCENGYEPVDVYFEKETEQGVFLTKWNAAEFGMTLWSGEHSLTDETCMEGLRATVVGEQAILQCGEEIGETVRYWYGSFSLPDTLYAAEAGSDVFGYQNRYGLSFTEPFWIREESLVLRFFIRLENEEGEVLYYGALPEGITNNTWCQEAGTEFRTDTKEATYPICGGEVAVLYPGESSDNDYGIHGIY